MGGILAKRVGDVRGNKELAALSTANTKAMGSGIGGSYGLVGAAAEPP